VPVSNLKQEAHRLIEQLPNNATWEDLIYQLYIRQAIAFGSQGHRPGKLLAQASGLGWLCYTGARPARPTVDVAFPFERDAVAGLSP
jgi:hypothetical protein